jgi:hypothetical protein
MNCYVYSQAPLPFVYICNPHIRDEDLCDSHSLNLIFIILQQVINTCSREQREEKGTLAVGED